MKKKKRIFFFIVLFVLVALGAAFRETATGVRFVVPKGWPSPHYDFKNNPLTLEGFELGRELFYDPLLSSDSSTSCASCHLSFTAFTHADHKVSHGIQGLTGTRNSLTLINMAWNTSFMWDGGVNNLEVQAINPLTNPVEMNSNLNEVVSRLRASAKYKKLFYRAFSDTVINSKKMLKALAQFTGNLISSNSKYDSVIRKEGNVHFTDREEAGYALFKQNCASCHTEPLFTNYSFQNNGLVLDTALKDIGRMKITANSSDSLKFKVPTLRNIEYSAPYFHDGRVNKLKDAVEHYTSGITDSPTLAPVLKKKIALSAEQKMELVAFLKTLTDKSFLYNVQYRQQL
ncbi:MAG TPA: cytochrome c peroxidase [Bacteroidia bacterium]|jgi:cytochrome c peroxidase|nr:cytochrome c peroxidase [Bacteroidia bacterium]